MTREEAIKWFRESPFWHEDHEPFNMAIKALEQEPTTKNDLGVEKIVDVLGSYTDLDIPYKHKIAEDILNNLPSVTPQESILDKIRAEIEQLTIVEGGDDYVRKMAELFSLKMKVLQIIDKYKAETEAENGNITKNS